MRPGAFGAEDITWGKDDAGFLGGQDNLGRKARLAGLVTHLVATPQMALQAAAAVARAAGVTPLILGDAIEGEARDVAKVMAAIALQVVKHGQPLAAPCVLLSGGETTVTVRGGGRGGRNVEFLLALAPEGTRTKVDSLRSGFYHIARMAGVPILPVGFDFKTKQVVLGELLYPGTDEEADFKKILAFYSGFTGKHPEKDLRHLQDQTYKVL